MDSPQHKLQREDFGEGIGDEAPDLTKGLIYEVTLIDSLLGAGRDWGAWLQWRKEVT